MKVRFKKMRVLRFVNCALLSAAIFGLNSSAQTLQPAQQVPVHLLYRHFLAYQNHLDHVAAVAVTRGKDGSSYRNHFQQKLGFTDKQFILVRAAAAKMEADLAKQDAKAKALIDAAHQQHPTGQLNSRDDAPPIPAGLVELQQQRDQLIKDEVAALKTALGPANAAKLDSVIQNDFAPNVTIQMIPITPHDPRQGKPPAFSQAVQ